MEELNHKEGCVPKNWSLFRTVVLEKTLECPLDCKEIQPVNPKGNQPWIFSGRTDAESPILWPPDGKSQLIGEKQKQKQTKKKKKEKTHPDNGKYWRQEQKVWQRTRWLDVISNPMERVWASFGKWWWTGKPGIRKFIGSQGVKQDWETEQQKPGRVFMYSWMNLNRAFLNFWKWVEHNFLTRSLAATHVEYFVFVVNLLCSFPGWHLGVSVPHNDGCCLSQSQLNWSLDHDLCFRRQPSQLLWLFEWLMILCLVLCLFLQVQTVKPALGTWKDPLVSVPPSMIYEGCHQFENFEAKQKKQIVHGSMPCSKMCLYIGQGWQSVIANTAHIEHFASFVTVLHVFWSVLKDNSQILQTVEGSWEAWTLSMWHWSWNGVGNWWWQCWQVVWISQLSPFCLSSSRWFLTWVINLTFFRTLKQLRQLKAVWVFCSGCPSLVCCP